MVLNHGDSVPVSLQTLAFFGCPYFGGGGPATGVWWVEGGDAASLLPVPGRPPPAGKCLAPVSVVLKLGHSLLPWLHVCAPDLGPVVVKA